MSRVLIALALLLSVACGSGAREFTAPSAVTGPLRLGLAGQSNAKLIEPSLREVADVRAFAWEVTTIAPCWSSAGACWGILRPMLPQPLDAFVWWQGEQDALLETVNYPALLSELVARIRAENGNPRLLIVIPQMGPMFDGPRMGTAGDVLQRQRREWAAADGNALYIETQDKEYRTDEVHMTDQGYRDVSARIVERVTARLGR